MIPALEMRLPADGRPEGDRWENAVDNTRPGR